LLDRPPLTEAAIGAALRDRYGVETTTIDFLALGQDVLAWTFRGRGASGADVFVKVRAEIVPAKLAAVAFLRDSGIEEIVAPIRSVDGQHSARVDGLVLVVYPFVEAPAAVEVGLTDGQWIDYGRIVGRLHRTLLPREISEALPAEDWMPKALPRLGRIRTAVAAGSDEPDRAELVALWRSHQAEIEAVAERAQDLGARLRNDAGAEADAGRETFVPCHGDIHTHNLLVDTTGTLHVIDWDEICMAPPERDLMFLLGSPIGLAPGTREADLFLRGYGPVAVDPVRLAYYHADWAIQDLVGYAEVVMLADVGSETRASAVRIFGGLLGPGDEVDVALRATTW
jgi:spectinomycin phosphotransferase